MDRKFTIAVTQTVEVELDDAKFDEAFMEEFRESFYPFFELSDHAKHIAQLQARGVIDLSGYSGEFIEGYGPSEDMGIKARVIETDIESARQTTDREAGK